MISLKKKSVEKILNAAANKLYVVLGVQRLKYDGILIENSDFFKKWNTLPKIKEGLCHMTVKRKEGWVSIVSLSERFIEDEKRRFAKNNPKEHIPPKAHFNFNALPLKKANLLDCLLNNYYLNLEKYDTDIMKDMQEQSLYRQKQKREQELSSYYQKQKEWQKQQKKIVKKDFLIIESSELSKKDIRYVVVDATSGEILDDAQGYGYKSKEKAMAGFIYKRRNGCL